MHHSLNEAGDISVATLIKCIIIHRPHGYAEESRYAGEDKSGVEECPLPQIFHFIEIYLMSQKLSKVELISIF